MRIHGELFQNPGSGPTLASGGGGCQWHPLPGFVQSPGDPQLGYIDDFNGGMAAFDPNTGLISTVAEGTPGPANYCYFDGAGRIMAKPGFDWVKGVAVAPNVQSFIYAWFTTETVVEE